MKRKIFYCQSLTKYIYWKDNYKSHFFRCDKVAASDDVFHIESCIVISFFFLVVNKKKQKVLANKIWYIFNSCIYYFYYFIKERENFKIISYFFVFNDQCYNSFTYIYISSWNCMDPYTFCYVMCINVLLCVIFYSVFHHKRNFYCELEILKIRQISS